MDEGMTALFEQIERRPGASETAINALVGYTKNSLGGILPGDFLDFLRSTNGAIGRGPRLFAILDRAEEIPQVNDGYGVSGFAPGLLVIGSDGCGNLLGIDTRAGIRAKYVRLDAMDIGWDNTQRRETTLYGLLSSLDTQPES